MDTARHPSFYARLGVRDQTLADHLERGTRPFVWTKTADEILATLSSYLQRISGTGQLDLKQVDLHTHLKAARLALGHAGLDADRLVVLAAVQERATFRAGRAVVKVDSDARRLKHELAMMTAARGVGVPVPGVIAFERGSPAVLVMQHMPGEALRPAHGPEPVREVGRLLRRLHSLPAPREAAWDLHLCAWTDLRTRQLVERHLLHAEMRPGSDREWRMSARYWRIDRAA